MKVTVPVGKSGDWEVSRFTVSKQDSDMTRFDAMKYGRGFVPEGEYTRLTYRGGVVMSDTPDEMRDHREPIWRAKKAGGYVLINGLGLGMVVDAILEHPNVLNVRVIEKSTDVIHLVGPYYRSKYGKRFTVIEADALTYKPERTAPRYSVVWHDIWSAICSTNYEEMKTLTRKYARRCDWQGSWCRYEVERHRKSGR